MRAGVVGAFAGPDEVLAAARALGLRGYRELEAFTPSPVPGLAEALHLGRSRLGWLIAPVSFGGAAFAFFVMWFVNAWDYPIDVGGRPPFAVPAFVPITFEVGVLSAAVFGFVALFWACGLPRFSHPLFHVDGFERASIDLYWLAIDAGEARRDPARAEDALRELGATHVTRFGRWP